MLIETSPVLPAGIYDALRSSILDQQDAPGTAVTESAVSLRFGVARPTAKIAIERLVAEGLLRRQAHHAARVPELGRDDIVDLFENRATVEVAAISALTANRTTPTAALDAHTALLERARADAPFAHEDIAFHRALVAGQPSPRLARMHALLMGEIELCIGQVQAHHLLTARDVAAQHQGILDAISAGDVAVAARLTREHIAGTQGLLLAHYDSTHD
jgi:DNA-binding GntR family transcriptional regulator